MTETLAKISPPAAHRARLLLIDDDRLVLAALTRGLRSEGYEVCAASDGAEALDAAGQGGWDLAIVDMRLPDTNGIDLARTLNSTWNLPSLFLSAYDERELVEAAAAEGGLGYLVKPISPRQLLPTIEAALARARDLRALFETKERLERAVDSGRYTSTAVGILMERRGLSRDEAFQILRSEARNQRTQVEALASNLVKALNTVNTLSDGPSELLRK